MWDGVAALLKAILEVFVGIFKRDKPEEETVQNAKPVESDTPSNADYAGLHTRNKSGTEEGE